VVGRRGGRKCVVRHGGLGDYGRSNNGSAKLNAANTASPVIENDSSATSSSYCGVSHVGTGPVRDPLAEHVFTGIILSWIDGPSPIS
jgi:hypothetical protein